MLILLIDKFFIFVNISIAFFEKEVRKIEEGNLVGKISHYFGRKLVAVLELSCCLKVGDRIRVVGGRCTDFTQKINSMEIDHKKIPAAEAGEVIGIRVKEPVREGYRVYKL